MVPTEAELLQALDEHDTLVERCARGELTFAELEASDGSFYVREPLPPDLDWALILRARPASARQAPPHTEQSLPLPARGSTARGWRCGWGPTEKRRTEGGT